MLATIKQGSYAVKTIVRNLSIGLSLGVAVVLVTPTVSMGELDLPHINAVLDNHEARITNAEANISAIQAQANITPAPVQVEVPVVEPAPQTAPEATPSPTIAPTPEPRPVINNVCIIGTIGDKTCQ